MTCYFVDHIRVNRTEFVKLYEKYTNDYVSFKPYHKSYVKIPLLNFTKNNHHFMCAIHDIKKKEMPEIGSEEYFKLFNDGEKVKILKILKNYLSITKDDIVIFDKHFLPIKNDDSVRNTRTKEVCKVKIVDNAMFCFEVKGILYPVINEKLLTYQNDFRLMQNWGILKEWEIIKNEHK